MAFLKDGRQVPEWHTSAQRADATAVVTPSPLPAESLLNPLAVMEPVAASPLTIIDPWADVSQAGRVMSSPGYSPSMRATAQKMGTAAATAALKKPRKRKGY